VPNVIVDQRAVTGTANAPWRLLSRSGGTTEVLECGKGTHPRFYYYIHSLISDTESIPTAVEAPEQQFRSLVEQWRRETGMLSSILKKAMHPAYQRIIGMGPRAIIPILRELQLRPDHWFWALTYITGENPVPQEAAGNLRRMAWAWIEWGRQKGYIS